MAELIQLAEGYPVLLFLFIVFARVADVSLGTVRTICVVKGKQLLAAGLGFLEVMIWVVAVSGVLSEITVLRVVAFGLGFSLGNLLGIWIESKLALGRQMLIIISPRRARSVAFALRLADYRVTELGGRGRESRVTICIAVVRRRNTPKAVVIARGADPDCFINVNDVHENEPLPGLERYPQATVFSTGWRAIFKKK